MIGLVDWDFQTTQLETLVPPNIEIMKLATYYQQEEKTFCKLVSLDEKDLTIYSKIFFFSEAEDTVKVPEMFLRAKNVIYGGTAFTNGVYIPFENSIIDYTLPRPYVYKEILKEKYNNGTKFDIIGHVLDDTYYRCYADDEQLPIPPIKRLKRFFIYDKEFFNPNWEKIIDTIIEERPSSIISIHPIICHTMSQYCKVRQNPYIKRGNKIILDFNIPLDDLAYLFNKYRPFLLQDIVPSSTVYVSLGGNYISSLQYYKNFIYKMNLLYSFWAKNVPIKIYYIAPYLGYKDPIEKISKLAATWSVRNAKGKTLRQRIYPKSVKHSPMQDEWERLLKFYPSANDLLNQTYDDLCQRGFWLI